MPERPLEADDARFQALKLWFAQQAPAIAKALDLTELPAGTFQAAGSDASFRRYFRWRAGALRLVLMDAPPPQEDCAPFVKVAEILAQAGLNVPKILAQELQQGFLVLSDLGQHTWLEVLTEDNAEAHFRLAMDTLIRLQRIETDGLALPAYDEALLRRELQLFPDWYVRHELGVELDTQQQGWWQISCDAIVAAALAQSRVLVHRDYMPRNLMQSEPNPGVLDFQDAVVGPVSYDPISLFKDAFVSWPPARVQQWLEYYWTTAQQQGVAVPATLADFQRDCDWMGLQRHLKVIGIFARIRHRDGKPRYLADVPRFFGYIQPVVQRYPELDALRQLLASLPQPRNAP